MLKESYDLSVENSVLTKVLEQMVRLGKLIKKNDEYTVA